MGRMKIVLRQDVDNLGEVGDVVTVTGGYARNFLIPRGLAVPATKGNVKQADDWKQGVAARSQRELAHYEDLKAKLEAAPLEVKAPAGPDGRLFGSITSMQVAETIAAKLGIQIDRHDIEVGEPIRHLGFHEVEIRLHTDIVAKVTVEAVEG